MAASSSLSWFFMAIVVQHLVHCPANEIASTPTTKSKCASDPNVREYGDRCLYFKISNVMVMELAKKFCEDLKIDSSTGWRLTSFDKTSPENMKKLMSELNQTLLHFWIDLVRDKPLDDEPKDPSHWWDANKWRSMHTNRTLRESIGDNTPPWTYDPSEWSQTFENRTCAYARIHIGKNEWQLLLLDFYCFTLSGRITKPWYKWAHVCETDWEPTTTSISIELTSKEAGNLTGDPAITEMPSTATSQRDNGGSRPSSEMFLKPDAQDSGEESLPAEWKWGLVGAGITIAVMCIVILVVVVILRRKYQRKVRQVAGRTKSANCSVPYQSVSSSHRVSETDSISGLSSIAYASFKRPSSSRRGGTSDTVSIEDNSYAPFKPTKRTPGKQKRPKIVGKKLKGGSRKESSMQCDL